MRSQLPVEGEKRQSVIIGKITGHHGIKGWVKIHSYTRPLEQIFNYSEVQLSREQSTGRSNICVRISTFCKQGKGIIARIGEYSSREEAEHLVGCAIVISKDQLEELAEGEYYWMDIIGSRVVGSQVTDGDTVNIEFGIVRSMMETGANDIMVVESDDDSKEHLIPWIPDVIESFDQVEKLIKVNWQEDD